MINIKTYASGSSGNLYTVDDGQTRIMIEAGIRFRKIQERLDFKLHEIGGCLVSHSHKDHSKAVKEVSGAGINCFISVITKNEVGVSGHRIKTFKSKEIFSIGSWSILPFELQHDVENHGFLMQSGQYKVLYLTDSYYSKYSFKGITHFMVECNYHHKILQENIDDGLIPLRLKNRILKSHFSFANVKKFFKANDLTKCEEIHLIHISKNNGNPEYFRAEIQKLTGVPCYTITNNVSFPGWVGATQKVTCV